MRIKFCDHTHYFILFFSYLTHLLFLVCGQTMPRGLEFSEEKITATPSLIALEKSKKEISTLIIRVHLEQSSCGLNLAL